MGKNMKRGVLEFPPMCDEWCGWRARDFVEICSTSCAEPQCWTQPSIELASAGREIIGVRGAAVAVWPEGTLLDVPSTSCDEHYRNCTSGGFRSPRSRSP